MQAVLYICHGSRLKEAQAQVAEFMTKCMAVIDIPIQEYCFLELASPSLEQGVQRCLERGATRIAIVPLLLLLAGHAKHDIPQQISRLQQQYPEVSFTYGRPLGVHDDMIDIIVDRMLEQQNVIDKDAHVLLVGRGSSDPDIKQYFHDIERRLEQKTGLTNVTTCYLAACEPNFETGLASVLEHSAKQVFIIPYLLFTGILMHRLQDRVARLEGFNRTIFLCNHLHFHKNIIRILATRVRETLGEEEEDFL